MKINESRNYIVPLRKGWLKVPRWRRSKRAVAELKKFLERHTKADEIKLSNWINELIWAHGGKNPPAKIAIKVELKEEEIGKTKKEKIKVAYADLQVLTKRAERIEDKAKKTKAERDKKKSLKEKAEEAIKGVTEKKPAAEESKAEKTEEPKTYKCDYCDEVFDSKGALKMHLRDNHRDEEEKKKQAKVSKAAELKMNK